MVLEDEVIPLNSSRGAEKKLWEKAGKSKFRLEMKH